MAETYSAGETSVTTECCSEYASLVILWTGAKFPEGHGQGSFITWVCHLGPAGPSLGIQWHEDWDWQVEGATSNWIRGKTSLWYLPWWWWRSLGVSHERAISLASPLIPLTPSSSLPLDPPMMEQYFREPNSFEGFTNDADKFYLFL